MKTLELSRFTGFYQLTFPRDIEPAESQVVLGDFLGRLAIACEAAGAEVIGHIKLLATNPNGGYLHGSVTSTHGAADVVAIDIGAHRSLNVHLIVLVYGAEKDDLERAILNVWSNLIDKRIIISAEQLPSSTFD